VATFGIVAAATDSGTATQQVERTSVSDSFSAGLWRGIAPIYQAILDHPFVTGLADGSLPREAFEFYVLQDALYLRKYAQALAVAASRAPDPAGTEMFARHAAGIVAAELELHRSLLAQLEIAPEVAAGAQEAPTTLAYTSYLLATTTHGTYAEGVGALLPCYWIYSEVGRHLLDRGSPDPRYQQWIDTYGTDEFGAETREVIEVADALAGSLTEADKERVGQHFTVTSRYEWMFWDMGYRREGWPL
jgi:thiaminase/transcriptional activator TenA